MNTVSLLIPCYQCAESIEMVLDSALEQSEPFEEIICYVDGSSDNTLDVLLKYKESKFSRLSIINSVENNGVSYARNRLLESASCQYVLYQDSDDPLHPHFLERMRPHLKKRFVTLCLVEQQELNGKKVIQGRKIDKNRETDIEYFISNFHQLNSVIFDKNFLHKIGGFLETISQYEDKEILIRFVLSGGCAWVVPEVLAYWIKRKGSLMHSQGWKNHNKHLLLMAQNLEPFFQKTEKSVAYRWRLYLSSKLGMVYYTSGCTAYFKKLQKYVALPEKKVPNLICKVFGYSWYLWIVKIYRNYFLFLSDK